MEYNPQYQNVILNLIPVFIRKEKVKNYLYAVIKPLQILTTGIIAPDYDSGATYSVGDKVKRNNKYYFCRIEIASPETFNLSKWASMGNNDTLKDITDNGRDKLVYNSQKKVLEQFLNDNYDSLQRRINVVTGESVINYIFNSIESLDVFYLYNNWDSTFNYQDSAGSGGGRTNGDFVFQPTDNKIYECILTHTNQSPPNATYWSEDAEIDYFYNNGGSQYNTDYIVEVPTGILGTQEDKFRAEVEQFNIATKTWDISNI